MPEISVEIEGATIGPFVVHHAEEYNDAILLTLRPSEDPQLCWLCGTSPARHTPHDGPDPAVCDRCVTGLGTNLFPCCATGQHGDSKGGNHGRRPD